MNVKMFIPTYANRNLYLRRWVRANEENFKCASVLNLGCGEGDYDLWLSSKCAKLTSVDINESDIKYARQLNRGVDTIHYQIEDATNLSFADSSYDYIISCEVIEHVDDSEKMIKEVQRVLKPGGKAFVSCPNYYFPFTYDPINFLLKYFKYKIPLGAYGYGHWKLMKKDEIADWAHSSSLIIEDEMNITGSLLGLLEMYWASVIQYIFKHNNSNLTDDDKSLLKIRPGKGGIPWVAHVYNFIDKIDNLIYRVLPLSAGLAFVFRKSEK